MTRLASCKYTYQLDISRKSKSPPSVLMFCMEEFPSSLLRLISRAGNSFRCSAERNDPDTPLSLLPYTIIGTNLSDRRITLSCSLLARFTASLSNKRVIDSWCGHPQSFKVERALGRNIQDKSPKYKKHKCGVLIYINFNVMPIYMCQTKRLQLFMFI